MSDRSARSTSIWLIQAGAALVACAGLSQAADLPTAKVIAADMGFGWNLGNTLETPSSTPTSYWSGHNPTQATFNAVKAAGFKSVRIPCAWNSHANTSTNVIDASWLAEVKRSVDFAINAGLYVIINIHWDGGWLEENVKTGSQASVTPKQKTYWTQIATYFKDYDQHLLFAGTNEPAVEDATSQTVLKSYLQTFIDAVRATGGNNASRTLIIQGPSTDIEKTSKLMTSLPTDKIADRLMAEVHFYPYQYSLMTKPATDWVPGKTFYPFYYWGSGNHSSSDPNHNPDWGEEAFVDQMFQLMKTQFVDKNIPTIIGEWGAGYRSTLSGDNLALHKKGRLAFYKYVQKAAKSRGLIPFAWDTNYKGDMNFTIIEREQGTVYDLDLMNAMRAGWDMGAVSVASRGSSAASGLQVSGNRATYLAGAAGPATVSLKDVQGRTLWSRTFAGQAGSNTIELPAAHKGLGVLQVRQGDELASASYLAD